MLLSCTWPLGSPAVGLPSGPSGLRYSARWRTALRVAEAVDAVVVAVPPPGLATTLRPRPLVQRRVLEAGSAPGLRSLAPGPSAGPKRRGAHRGASHAPGTHHWAAATIRRGPSGGGKGPHESCVRFCALLGRPCGSRLGRGWRQRDRRLSSTARQTVVGPVTLRKRRRLDRSCLPPFAPCENKLLDVRPKEAIMPPKA